MGFQTCRSTIDHKKLFENTPKGNHSSTKKPMESLFINKSELRVLGVDLILVGGFNLSEKYARQIGVIFPKVRGEN